MGVLERDKLHPCITQAYTGSMMKYERVLKYKVDLLFAIIVRYSRNIVVLKLLQNLSNLQRQKRNDKTDTHLTVRVIHRPIRPLSP